MTSSNYGRSIVTDGLVGYWDFNSKRSFAGEPTENLVSNPSFENGMDEWNVALFRPASNNHEVKVVDVDDGPVGKKAIYVKKEEVLDDGYMRVGNCTVKL